MSFLGGVLPIRYCPYVNDITFFSGSNPCDKAACSHLCFLTPTGVACACGDSGEIVVNGTVICLGEMTLQEGDSFGQKVNRKYTIEN